MEYKKIIILPALFIFSNLLYIGCCKCVDAGKLYYDVESLSVQPRGSGNAVIDTGIITTVDSVFLNYAFDFHCTASHQNPFSFLVNSSYACKCDECGYNGLKTKLVSLEISSDSIYNGIAANSSLNSLFRIKYYDNNFVSIDSVKNLMNTSRVYSLTLFTTTKPGNTKGHKLKLKMLFTDGRELAVSTNTIYWQ